MTLFLHMAKLHKPWIAGTATIDPFSIGSSCRRCLLVGIRAAVSAVQIARGRSDQENIRDISMQQTCSFPQRHPRIVFLATTKLFSAQLFAVDLAGLHVMAIYSPRRVQSAVVRSTVPQLFEATSTGLHAKEKPGPLRSLGTGTREKCRFSWSATVSRRWWC